MTKKNVVLHLTLSSLFGIKNLKKKYFDYIKLNFSLVKNEQNFLNLSFNILQKILSSSELQIDSEFEVLAAASDWINHDAKERASLAIKLLSNVRLHLLSDAALTSALNDVNLFSNCAACKAAIENAKNKHSVDQSSLPNRFCSQKNYKLVAFGEKDHFKKTIPKVFEVDDISKEGVKNLPPLCHDRECIQVVADEVKTYVLGGTKPGCYGKTAVTSIEAFSEGTNGWQVVGEMPEELQCFCACTFMGKLYLIGTFFEEFAYNCVYVCDLAKPKLEWETSTFMNKSRCNAACSVFQGKIAVTGGWYCGGETLDSAEAFDHVAEEWTFMPKMVCKRRGHGSVAIRNRLYLVGGWKQQSVEFYDSVAGTFTFVQNSVLRSFKMSGRGFFVHQKTVCVGERIYVFANDKPMAAFYDINEEKWTTFEVNSKLQHSDHILKVSL